MGKGAEKITVNGNGNAVTRKAPPVKCFGGLRRTNVKAKWEDYDKTFTQVSSSVRTSSACTQGARRVVLGRRKRRLR